MATKKQIAANRRGARTSTGPRTAAGEARAAQNAVTRGLTGRSPLLPDEDREEFTAFAAGVLADLAPLETLEVACAARVADGMWQLLRIGRIEAAARAARLREIPELPHCAAQGEEHALDAAFLKLDAGGLPNSLARYEAALQRGVERSLKLLQETRAQRRAAQELALRNKPDSSAAQAGQGFQDSQPDGVPANDPSARQAGKAEGGADEPELTWVPFPPDERRSGQHGVGQDAARAARRNEPDSPAAQAGQGSLRPRVVSRRLLPPLPACTFAGC